MACRCCVRRADYKSASQTKIDYRQVAACAKNHVPRKVRKLLAQGPHCVSHRPCLPLFISGSLCLILTYSVSQCSPTLAYTLFPISPYIPASLYLPVFSCLSLSLSHPIFSISSSFLPSRATEKLRNYETEQLSRIDFSPHKFTALER